MLLVGIPGFEPGMTGPESVVLPLHHIPICFATEVLPNCDCKGTSFSLNHKGIANFFTKKNQKEPFSLVFPLF